MTDGTHTHLCVPRKVSIFSHAKPLHGETIELPEINSYNSYEATPQYEDGELLLLYGGSGDSLWYVLAVAVVEYKVNFGREWTAVVV